jgi:uncharacterized membrane protein YfcA
VRYAIVIMTVPNLVTNLLQVWQNRRHHLRPNFLVPFMAAAAAGVLIGTWILAGLDSRTLSLFVAVAVLLYLALRLFKRDWQLDMAHARWLAAPFGFVSGVVQGSAGISAPVSLSFINAMQLERRVFVNTVSLLFVTFVAVQLPALALTGIMTQGGFMFSCLALLPLLLGMPLGAWISRHISRQTFDRLIMLLLAGLALRMLWAALL